LSFKHVLIYKTFEEREPFIDWLKSLDKVVQLRIRKRVAQLEIGHFGGYKFLGFGVYELRFFFNSGYRVYFGLQGDLTIFLLCGGHKASQAEDIKKAIRYWKDIKNATHNQIISRLQH